MTSRNLVVLAVAALLALGAGLWLAGQRSAGPALGNDLFYPTLQGELDAVTEVRILAPGGGNAVTLKRQEDGWRVGERQDYRADAAKVRRLLLALADAKVFEAKTANPEQYATLGVQDIGAADAGSVQVELHGTSQPYRVIVGKRGNGRNAYFVRRVDEPQSWLVDADLDAKAAPGEWLHREVLDISPDRVQSAQVSVGQTRPYTVAKQSRADENFAVDGLPRGKKLKSASAADGFATALSAINLTDVKPADQVVTDSAKPAARSVFMTFDGLRVEAQGHRDGDDHWLTLTTAFDAAHAERFKLPVLDDAASPNAGTKDGDAPASGNADAAAPLSAPTGAGTLASAADAPRAGETTSSVAAADDTHAAAASRAANGVEQESQQLNQQLAGWAFQIPAFKYEALFKPVAELTD